MSVARARDDVVARDGRGGVLEEYGAAGHVDDDAAYPRGVVGGEEQGRLGDVFWGAESADGMGAA